MTLELNDEQRSTLHKLWLETGTPQGDLANLLGIPTWVLSDYIADTFTPAQRTERNSRIQAEAQSTMRVARPGWYTGSGRSVPLKVLVYCEQRGVSKLPNNTAVVHLDGDKSNYDYDNLSIMSRKEAKKFVEAQRNEPQIQPPTRRV
jgi:hypothetical protein